MTLQKEKQTPNIKANKNHLVDKIKNVAKSKETTEKTLKPKKPAKKAKGSGPVENINLPNIIPKSYPDDLIVSAKNFPDKSKQSDIITAFTRFGSITYLQKISSTHALIGFLEPEGALAAIQARKVLIRGKKVTIKRRKAKQLPMVEPLNSGDADELWQRTIFVFHIDPTTTEEDIRKHFKHCGTIESTRLFKKKYNSYFKIVFEQNLSADEALKLHNTVLKENTIHIRRKSNEPIPWDLKRTIILQNPGRLTKIDGSKITKLFKGCGEIEKCDVFCYKNRLAMLSFKNEEGAQKALKLNGTTKNGIQIEVILSSEKFQKQAIQAPKKEALNNLLNKSKKWKVCIKKIAEVLTEKDIHNLFSTCGPVKSVTISEDRSAVIEFENVQGYCKAFLLHEFVYGGIKLILKPFSEQKMPEVKENKKQKGKRSSDSNENTQPAKKLKKKV